LPPPLIDAAFAELFFRAVIYLLLRYSRRAIAILIIAADIMLPTYYDVSCRRRYAPMMLYFAMIIYYLCLLP